MFKRILLALWAGALVAFANAVTFSDGKIIAKFPNSNITTHSQDIDTGSGLFIIADDYTVQQYDAAYVITRNTANFILDPREALNNLRDSMFKGGEVLSETNEEYNGYFGRETVGSRDGDLIYMRSWAFGNRTYSVFYEAKEHDYLAGDARGFLESVAFVF